MIFSENRFPLFGIMLTRFLNYLTSPYRRRAVPRSAQRAPFARLLAPLDRRAYAHFGLSVAPAFVV
jgi:hypothetical protein